MYRKRMHPTDRRPAPPQPSWNHLLPSLALCVAMALLPGLSVALESDRNQPIELAADSVDIDENQGRSVYKGDVDLRQGTMRLLADIVTVYQQARKPTKIIAEGRPVKFSQQSESGPVKGEAQRMEYEVGSENLVMIGNAVVIQNKDSMRSDRITYDRVRSVVKAGAAAQGKQRVRIRLEAPAE